MQADYVRPLGKGHRVQGGLKYIHRSNESDAAMNYFLGDNTAAAPPHSSTTPHSGGAYGEWMWSKGKWSTRAGLRYEYSRLNAEYPTDASQTSART